MTLSDIKNRVYLLTKTNSTSFPAADLLIALNTALNRVGSLILQSDGRWSWDDDNQSDLPIATTTITSGQQDYSLPVSYLKITRVEIKLNGATGFTLLTPFDEQDDKVWALDNTGTGSPMFYDLQGRSVFLYPIPNYTQAASLKIYFQRGPYEFSSSELSTGSLSPGFSSLFHDLIPLWIAYDFYLANDQSQVGGLLTEIQRKETELIKYYSLRNKDDRPRITTAPISFR